MVNLQQIFPNQWCVEIKKSYIYLEDGGGKASGEWKGSLAP